MTEKVSRAYQLTRLLQKEVEVAYGPHQPFDSTVNPSENPWTPGEPVSLSAINPALCIDPNERHVVVLHLVEIIGDGTPHLEGVPALRRVTEILRENGLRPALSAELWSAWPFIKAGEIADTKQRGWGIDAYGSITPALPRGIQDPFYVLEQSPGIYRYACTYEGEVGYRGYYKFTLEPVERACDFGLYLAAELSNSPHG